MSTQDNHPYAALEKLFHEPNRLTVMSALCAAPDGLTFTELKRECDLTDGNLSRHLKALETAGAVRVEKAFAGVRPRTTVYLAETGRRAFLDYLKSLEAVLRKAEAAMKTEPKGAAVSFSARRPRASVA